MKLTKSLLCAATLLLGIAGAHAAELETIEKGALLIGSDQVYPPYDYVENGETKGLDRLADFVRL